MKYRLLLEKKKNNIYFISLIYIIMSNNNYDSGDFRFTPPIIPNTKLAGQRNVLTYQNAPRTTETAQTNGGPADNEYNNLSYRRSLNGFTSGPYSADKINPLGFPITQRADENPYFLFMGKFSSNSQGIQNTDPVQVGHVDISGITLNQQPSNIYNIPDIPKPYTLIQSTNTSGFYPNDYYKEGSLNSNLKIIYDASSCPVNWRMFGPIRDKVLDIIENGITGGGSGSGTLNTGLYDTSTNGSFSFVQNPSKRDISGIYFDTNSFDISFNQNTSQNAYVTVKGGIGTGVDLSFNEFFFKQPGMPLDCSCVFISGSPNDKIRIRWDKPFNRKAGTSYSQSGNRYFYKDDITPVENWLPNFTEFVLDISGGPNNRKFCKDASDNFIHTGGVSPNSQDAFALLSSNNTEINIEAQTNPGTGQIVATGTAYGTSGIITRIIDNFDPNHNNVNAGGTPNQSNSDIEIGNTYDIAIYYRNESKINTPPSLSNTDIKYNNHNVCLFENIIFGIPGFVGVPNSIVFWNNGPIQGGGRIYLGGIGPIYKDEKNNPPGEGLNLPWNNTSIIKVGYDCSLNMVSNIGNKVQAGESDGAGGFYGINNQGLSMNNFDVRYNLLANGIPETMFKTKQNWPNGSGIGGINSNSGATSLNDDYIKLIDIQSGVPSSSARDHPEYKYTITEYNVTNNTKDKTTGQVVPATDPNQPTELIIPINTRAYCNTTSSTEYNDMMVSKTETPITSSKTFLELYNRSGGVDTLFTKPPGWVGSNNNYFKARSRRGFGSGIANEVYNDVVFVDNNISLAVKSDSRVFRQLANYGEPLNNPTSQTQDGLVESEGYLGLLSSSTRNYLSKVQLLGEVGSSSSWSKVPDLDILYNGDQNPDEVEILGYTPSLSTLVQNKVQGNGGHDYKYSVSAPFDIAQNDSETIYSNKRGYYIGIDVSNVEVDLDPWSTGTPFKDVSLLSGVNKYNQYRIGLKHSAEKRQAPGVTIVPADEERIKELILRLAKKPQSDILIDNTSIKVDNYKSIGITFTKFFGVNRLPASNTGDDQVLGTGLELIVDFTLDNIDENWMPHRDFTGATDNIAEVHFVVDPTNNAGKIAQKNFTWDNISGNNNNPVGTGSENFKAFIEINEGISCITNQSSGTVKYSRTITEAPSARNLFGLYNNNIYYSHNVTFKGDQLEFTGSGATENYTNAQDYELLSSSSGTEDGQDKFKFDSGKELFWDYTWPILTSTVPRPTTITGCELLNLPGASVTSTPWGGNNIELPELGTITNAVRYNTAYNHSISLPDNQSMWCDGSFVSSNNANNSSNPYINYNTYAYQSENYTGKINTGDDVTGFTIFQNNRAFGTGNYTSTSFTNVKWILLKVQNVTGNVTVAIKDGNTFLILGTDYLLFYCEYNATKPYNVGGTPSCAYTGWLNALVSVSSTNFSSIKNIDQSGGSNTGCFATSGTSTIPFLNDFNTISPSNLN